MSREFNIDELNSLIEEELEAEEKIHEAIIHIEKLKKEAERKAQIMILNARADSIDSFNEVVEKYKKETETKKAILNEKYENYVEALKMSAKRNEVRIIKYIIGVILGV